MEDADFLRRLADGSFAGIKRPRLYEIADEYERMKHDLERHVKSAEMIGEAGERTYRLGWKDSRREMLMHANRSSDVPPTWLMHERFDDNRQEGE